MRDSLGPPAVGRPSQDRRVWTPDRVGFLLGPLLLTGWLVFTRRGDLSPEAHRLVGVLLLTLVWWATECVPVAVTGLLAVSLCVALDAVPPGERSVSGIKTVFAPFADPSVFFLMGGIFIGRAMSRHGLDRRFALALLTTRWAGRSPGTLLAAVGLAAVAVSMWVSNSAATAMLAPVAVGIVAVLAGSAGSDSDGDPRTSPYASALLLITAFGASVGGIATPIGTSTNVYAIGYLSRADVLGRQVDFFSWCVVGVPLCALIFAATFAWVRLQAPARGLDLVALRAFLRAEREKLGPWNRGEKNTLLVFIFAVSFWIGPGLLTLVGSAAGDSGPASAAPGTPPARDEASVDMRSQAWSASAAAELKRRLPEEVVAVLAIVLLFMLPLGRGRGFTLEADDFRRIDWGTLFLFGSALALGSLMDRTGLAKAAGTAALLALGTDDVWVLTAIAIASGLVLSEFTSNTAAVAALLPVVHQLCVSGGIDPLPPVFGLTFATSFGSVLPVSTPPNAIVYGTGLVPVRRMIRGGIGVDLSAAVLIWAGLRIAFGVAGWTPLARP